LTRQADVKIGEGIDPETSDISTYQFSQDGFDVALVDTPGFDDNRPHMSDSKLLGDMAQFLLKGYARMSSSIHPPDDLVLLLEASKQNQSMVSFTFTASPTSASAAPPRGIFGYFLAFVDLKL